MNRTRPAADQSGMEADMSGILAILLLIAVIVYVLVYLEVIDVLEAVGVLVKLAFSVLAMVAALLIWSARKLFAASRKESPSDVPQVQEQVQDPENRASVRRGKIETRTMARQRDRK
jgi:membrane protein implicated in regulation of membrane protease activity